MKLGDLPCGCHFLDRFKLIWLKTLESKDLAVASACILINMDIADFPDDFKGLKFYKESYVTLFGQRLDIGSRHLVMNESEVSQLETDFWLGDAQILSTLA